MEFKHYSVMLRETIDALAVKPDGIYVDGTMGGAGHSLQIASRLSERGRLICIDQDADAIAAGKEKLTDFSDRVTIVRSNYERMRQILEELGIASVNGILLDLGVSSYQLDTPERGFSYMDEGALLDMRMDCRNPRTARDIVNEYSERELFRMIRNYGEDRFAKNIAKNIVLARQEKTIETVGELNEVIRRSVPRKIQVTGGHPAKRTYQAIRIELNRELDVLRDHIDEMIDLLADGGRFAVISFHSLEDRIVKNAFQTAEDPCICPPEFPVCVCGRKSKGRVITRKPILPGKEELAENHRSRSAKLRVFERRVVREEE